MLGIFGREGVFAAAVWELSQSRPLPRRGLRGFRGTTTATGARFGDTSIGAATSNHVDTSLYASVDEGRDDRVVVVAINKTSGPVTAEILVTHPVDLLRGQAWQVTPASATPVRGPEVAATARNAFRVTLAPSSVTTIAIER